MKYLKKTKMNEFQPIYQFNNSQSTLSTPVVEADSYL